eukprot:PhM_4_TR15633/c0_g1_i1/m.78225
MILDTNLTQQECSPGSTGLYSNVTVRHCRALSVKLAGWTLNDVGRCVGSSKPKLKRIGCPRAPTVGSSSTSKVPWRAYRSGNNWAVTLRSRGVLFTIRSVLTVAMPVLNTCGAMRISGIPLCSSSGSTRPTTFPSTTSGCILQRIVIGRRITGKCSQRNTSVSLNVRGKLQWTATSKLICSRDRSVPLSVLPQISMPTPRPCTSASSARIRSWSPSSTTLVAPFRSCDMNPAGGVSSSVSWRRVRFLTREVVVVEYLWTLTSNSPTHSLWLRSVRTKVRRVKGSPCSSSRSPRSMSSMYGEMGDRVTPLMRLPRRICMKRSGAMPSTASSSTSCSTDTLMHRTSSHTMLSGTSVSAPSSTATAAHRSRSFPGR